MAVPFALDAFLKATSTCLMTGGQECYHRPARAAGGRSPGD